MYTILRFRRTGELTHFRTADKKYAYICYYTAEIFDVNEDCFIALFEREKLLINNQGRLHRWKKRKK
jgi:hypothetical protein